MALHAELRFGVRLFREPDAGNPPVRFDEREEETELSQTGMRRRGESPANRHREATVTAPLLDSTQNPLHGRTNEVSSGSNGRDAVRRSKMRPSNPNQWARLPLPESRFPRGGNMSRNFSISFVLLAV